MKFSLFERRKMIVLLVGLGLVLLLAGRQELSWAAPGQRPDQQTVPPRPPTDTPAPPPPPATNPPPNNDNDGDQNIDDPTVVPTLTVMPAITFTAVPENNPTASPVVEPEEGIDDIQPPVGETPGQDQTGSGPGADGPDTPLPEATPTPSDADSQSEAQIETTPPGIKATEEAQLDAVAGGIGSDEGWGVLYWLYALILGAILILLGMFLIRKS